MKIEVTYRGEKKDLCLKDTATCAEMHACVAHALSMYKDSYDDNYGYADELKEFYFLAALLVAFGDIDTDDMTLDDIAGMEIDRDKLLRDRGCWINDMYYAYESKVQRLAGQSNGDKLVGALLDGVKAFRDEIGEDGLKMIEQQLQSVLGELKKNG